MMGTQQQISGIITKVKHYSPDRGFHVVNLSPDDGRDAICATFRGPRVYEGQHAALNGSWESNAPFGNQFKAIRVVATPPRTPEGTAIYLASGILPGMGKQTAARATARFGNEVFDILTTTPGRLAEIRGVSPKKALAWGEAWQAVETKRRDAMAMLTSHGLTPSKAGKVHDVYVDGTAQAVTTNPYALTRTVKGMGFEQTDALALKLGVGADSPFRIIACANHLMQRAAKNDGHTGQHRDNLTRRVAATLTLPTAVVESALAEAVANGDLIAADLKGQPGLFLPELYKTEANVARHLREIADGPSPWRSVDVEETIAWVRPRLKHVPNEMQVAAIRQILTGKITVLTGGPGTGKTFILEAVALIAERMRLKLVQCALAGRAAQNMTDKTGMPAETIHATLGQSQGVFLHDSKRPLAANVVVLDEASMVNITLAWSLIQAIPASSALVLVGDVDQLEPIGAGNFFEDVIESKTIPTIRLTEITRQAAGSSIIVNAHRMNQGLMPIEDPTAPGQDFFFIETNDATAIVHKVVELVKNRIPTKFGMDAIRDTLVLTPMKKGPAGTHELNQQLRAALNPVTADTVRSKDVDYRTGDKIMQTVNDNDRRIRNGELGIIESIDVETDKVRLRFGASKVIDGESDLISNLLHGYAVTGHKSQGSEIPAVVIVVTMQHRQMLRRRLVYTKATRGKKLVVFVGQRRALRFAIENTNSVPRLTKFADWLRMAFDVANQDA